MLKLYFRKFGIIITVFLFPLISFAQVSGAACLKSGYTIETINGIFTKEGTPGGDDGAEANRKSVELLLPLIYKGEKLTVKYLYNPTHGLLDLTDVAIQKTFEDVDMQDPDFLKILNAASTQVKTQKVLVVAHSQGNFYANNFYKAVTDSGDVPTKSIGVYSVATPASYVAGGGIYRTSSTDTVINRARKALPGTFLPAHDSIDYKESDDDGRGHGFREIYLEYRGEEIKKEIEQSLSKLSVDPTRSEYTTCINPPKALSAFEKVTKPVVYSVDSVLATGTVALTARRNAIIDFAILTLKKDIPIAIKTYVVAVDTAKWTYDTTVALGKFVGNGVFAVGSAVYNAIASGLSSSGSVASSNSASVILATQSSQPQTQSQAPVKNQVVAVTNAVAQPQTPSVIAPQKPQAVFLFEPTVNVEIGMPKLVFVGSFDAGESGGSPTPIVKQVLGSVSGTNEVLAEEEVAADEDVIAGVALATPALSVPQCAQTLAIDGCLLATTTVHFEWPAVAGADYYAINQNGEYATTTDTSLDITIKDFSDYTLEISAVGADGNVSATSTQKVSVATIPLAINEIAWAGTSASSNDEWFEIKNNTAHTINLSQWELNAKNSTPHIKLAGTIASRAYLVFERTNDDTVKDVAAHQTYSGALGNAGEQLDLSYASTTLDQTPEILDGGAWAGGSNTTTTRKTMERYSSKESGTDHANWGTNLGYIKNGTDADDNLIDGTPSAQNSVSTLINKGRDITEDFILTADEERYVSTKNGVWVHASTTLTIEPGVTISFYGINSYDSQFFIEGTINARGTAEKPIVLNSFFGNQTGGIWIDTATGTSTFDNVHFENIGDMGVFDSGVEIRNSEFVHTDGGINAYGESTVIVTNSNFAGITRDAIGAYGKSNVYIASSTITNQLGGDAIGVYDGSSLVLASTTIDGVHDGDGIGVYESTLSISSSTVKNVSDDGIGLYDATATISNTVVENGGENGIGIYGGTATISNTAVSGFAGSGVAISTPVEPVIITGGEVNGNSIGVSMDAGSAVLTDVSVHDNGIDGEENVVVW